MGGNSITEGSGGGLRNFNVSEGKATGNSEVVSPSLISKIDSTVADIKNKGLLEAYLTNKGVEATAGFKITNKWTTGAFISKNWQGPLTYGVRVKGEF